MSLTLSLQNATVVEFTVHCQTRLQSFKGTVDSRYKGSKSLFFISKCSGDIIISYMEEYTIFCTRMELTSKSVMSLDFADALTLQLLYFDSFLMKQYIIRINPYV